MTNTCTFPRDVAPGTVIKVTNRLGQTSTHTATGYAKVGERYVSAKARNNQMPSGWELSDVLLLSSNTVELI